MTSLRTCPAEEGPVCWIHWVSRSTGPGGAAQTQTLAGMARIGKPNLRHKIKPEEEPDSVLHQILCSMRIHSVVEY